MNILTILRRWLWSRQKISTGHVWDETIVSHQEVKIGHKVLTPDGYGYVHSLYHRFKFGDCVGVYFPKFGKITEYHITKCSMLVLFDFKSDRRIKLSMKDYDYILENGQEIQYYVTKHKFASLTEEYRHDHQWIKIINSTHNGRILLKKLKTNNFIINKKLKS